MNIGAPVLCDGLTFQRQAIGSIEIGRGVIEVALCGAHRIEVSTVHLRPTAKPSLHYACSCRAVNCGPVLSWMRYNDVTPPPAAAQKSAVAA